MQATLAPPDEMPVVLGPLRVGATIPDPALLLFLYAELEDEQAPTHDADLDDALALRCASL